MVFDLYRSWAGAIQDALPAIIPLGIIGACSSAPRLVFFMRSTPLDSLQSDGANCIVWTVSVRALTRDEWMWAHKQGSHLLNGLLSPHEFIEAKLPPLCTG